MLFVDTYKLYIRIYIYYIHVSLSESPHLGQIQQLQQPESLFFAEFSLFNECDSSSKPAVNILAKRYKAKNTFTVWKPETVDSNLSQRYLIRQGNDGMTCHFAKRVLPCSGPSFGFSRLITLQRNVKLESEVKPASLLPRHVSSRMFVANVQHDRPCFFFFFRCTALCKST